MASGINKVILVGNLGKDPEVQSFENGVKRVTFSLATTEVYRAKDGNKVTQTEWHNIILWRGLAEVAEKYLARGKQVYIEGRIRTRSWEDKDGNKRYITEILGDNMLLLGGPKGEHPVVESSGTIDEVNNQIQNLPPMDDDLPF